METAIDLFKLSPSFKAKFTTAGSSIPIIQIDNVYERPDEIRDMALSLPYSSPPYPYPGKLAVPPPP